MLPVQVSRAATVGLCAAWVCACWGEQVPALIPIGQPESVYAPPAPPREGDGINQGAVHLDFDLVVTTDYVWRGIERFEFDPDFPRSPGAPDPGTPDEGEDVANAQLNLKLRWDLGKFPSPFIRVFVDAAEDTDQPGSSSFREIQPTLGFDWNIRPLKFSFGNTNYIFPETDFDANGVPESGEVFARLEIDDSYFFKTERPIFAPYVFAAYDYDKFEGLYAEAGVSHTFLIEETPLAITVNGHVAYASGLSEIFIGNGGFQHYQVGVTADYSLNQLFNFSTRFGEWSLTGFINYTGEIDEDMRVDEQLWGGGGITFKY